MFDFVHNNKKFVQICMAMIIVPFALWGIDSFNRSGNGVDEVANVGGVKITKQEFANALLQQQSRLRQQLGSKMDEKIFDSPEMKRMVIENLIGQRLLAKESKEAGLSVTDEQIARSIEGVEAFNRDGKFDKNLYSEVLAAQNLTPLIFESRIRADMLEQQMQDAYEKNGFVSARVADNIIHLNEQQLIVRTSLLPIKQYEAQVKVSDLTLREYYDQNPKEFEVPEQVKVKFVKLSVDDLLSKAEVSTDELRRYYDEHLSEFGTPEERRAAHILINTDADAPQAEQDAAKSKAEELLREANLSPEKFSELAKKYSQDPGSSTNGGDLGYFARGMMVKPFEDSVFSLKVGEISGMVKSDFGYHIVKLLGIKPTKAISFEESREGILVRLRQQKAMEIFAELAEKFSNVVYEQSDTLDPAAELIGGKIEQSGWLSVDMVAATPWTPMMLQALFSGEVIKEKRNTPAIEVSDNTLLAARVQEYKPASIKPLAEVRDIILGKLLRKQAAELASRNGKEVLQQLQDGKTPKLTWESAKSITRSLHDSFDVELTRKIFQVSGDKLPQYVGSEASGDGYIIVRVDTVNELDSISKEKRKSYIQQLRKMTGDEMARAYLSGVRQQTDISLNVPGGEKEPL